MKVIVTGSNGQLAWELKKTCPHSVELVSLSRTDLDISNSEQVDAVIQQHQPSVVINAAAYTAVDKAETDQEGAQQVNEKGAENLAAACEKYGVYLLHISTDFVFDGCASLPYQPDSDTNPLGVYGATKLAGEAAVKKTMRGNWAIIRTAWVYSAHGGNFVKSMLRLMSEKPALGIVADQIGTPTWAEGLARVCWSMIEEKVEGLYHWTDAGVASWYDFAVAIQKAALSKGILAQAIPVNPIKSHEFPTPAKRPSYSVLDKSAIIEKLPNVEMKHWQDQLDVMLDELKEEAEKA